MKHILVNKLEEISTAQPVGSEAINVGGEGCDSISFQAVVDVDTPSAKTFDSGEASALVVQDLTYTAVTRGVAGDNITIAYTAGGTAGSEVVTVVGTAISVQIDDGVSTATEIETAIDASAAALLLVGVAVTGTGGNAQSIASATPLAGGVDSEVNVADNEITIPAHGLNTGLKGQLTSTGTLPAGVTTSTDYFVIVVDANTIQLATTLANAIAGTAIDLTDQGSSAAVNTFTATALAGGTIKLQQSNVAEPTESDWSDLGSATNITADGLVYLEKDRPTAKWVRSYITLTAGNISADLNIIGKGDKAG